MYRRSEFTSCVESFVSGIMLNTYNTNHIFSKEECEKVMEEIVTITQSNQLVRLETFVAHSLCDSNFCTLRDMVVQKITNSSANFSRNSWAKLQVQEEVSRANKEAKKFESNIKAQEKAHGILTKEYQEKQKAAESRKREQEAAKKAEKATSIEEIIKEFIPISPSGMKLHTLADELSAKVIELISQSVDGADILKASNTILSNMDKIHDKIDDGETDLNILFDCLLDDLKEYLKDEDIKSLKEEFISSEETVEEILQKLSEAGEKLGDQAKDKELSFEECVRFLLKEILGVTQDGKNQEEETFDSEEDVKGEVKLPTLDEINDNSNNNAQWNDCVLRFRHHLEKNDINISISDSKLLLKKVYKKALQNPFFETEEEAFEALLNKLKRTGLEKILAPLRKEKEDSKNSSKGDDKKSKPKDEETTESEERVQDEEQPHDESTEDGVEEEEVQDEQPHDESTEEAVEEEEVQNEEQPQEESLDSSKFPDMSVLSISVSEGEVEDPELLEDFNKKYMEGIKLVLPKELHDATKEYLEAPEKKFDISKKSKTQASNYLEEMASRYEMAFKNCNPERMPSYLIPYSKELDKLFSKQGACFEKNQAKFTNNDLITSEVARLIKEFLKSRKGKNGAVQQFQELAHKCKEFNKYILTDNVK